MKKKIGLIDVDGHNGYPNLALMKLSTWHKEQGDDVGWYNPFDEYDIVYKSKVFSFTPDVSLAFCNAKEVRLGGTGYGLNEELPYVIEHAVPDYDLYGLPKNVAYGFLTRGCPNKCKWCVVPHKEGDIHPHATIDEIAVDGRNRLILMDNNILASPFGIEQLRRLSTMKIWVDFNQGLDARLVTSEIADILAKIRWMNYIRFGCDTPKQVEECAKVCKMLRDRGCKKQILFYTMLYGDINECYDRLMFWSRMGNMYNVQAQPYIDIQNPKRDPPQWQKDMARWANRKELFHSCDFKDFSPRHGFKCNIYFKSN